MPTHSQHLFKEAYGKLNAEQKKAVDTIEGPVMVIAGPGTGKTQVLALRIAHILEATDTPADGILCLTFTNSGARAMRERLARLIGPESSRVTISTFHSFAAKILEEFYEVLALPSAPTLIDDKDAVILCDELLESGDWKYLRPRQGGAHNFKDLKSLISLAKREGLTVEAFVESIDAAIVGIKENPDNISSRGPTKGELKKEAEEKIIRLERTKEAGAFYGLYEKTKRERSLADYDDILAYLVELVEVSKDAADTIRERYLYVLVDEHQDSSGVQNEFLAKVWGGVEKPNLFVVGDDRQLIYGFGGASLAHFENFSDVFGGACTITLVENYRSTQIILDTANKILESTIAKGTLKSQSRESYPIRLIEAAYPRDEILAAGLAMKQKIAEGSDPSECVLLVPKNAQVRSAVPILLDLGLPVAAGGNVHFFALEETQSLLALLRVLSDPYDSVALGALLLDPIAQISTISAHRFLKEHSYKMSVETLEKGDETIQEFGKKLRVLLAKKEDPYSLVQDVAQEFFFSGESAHEELLRRIEVVRTMLHLVLARMEKTPRLTLDAFLAFIDRLESYGEDISLAVFSRDEGVRVMTLHGSKGLEFDFVWIAHLDEGSLMKGKRMGFTLPETLEEKVAKKDELTARRELYVALTRAKRFATMSYAREGYTGASQELAKIIALLPEDTLEKVSLEETERNILSTNPKAYVASVEETKDTDAMEEIKKLVEREYPHMKHAVTHLNNFFTCPWTWYFRNFLRLPEAKNESLEFGNLVHACMKRYFTDRTVAKDVARLVDEEVEKMKIFDEYVRGRFGRDANKVLSALLKEFGNADDYVRTEFPLSYRDPEFPELEITGKIDLIEPLDDETLRVTDFKTGKTYKKGEIEKRDEEDRLGDKLRQLAMYSYLISNQKEEKVVSSSRLLFVESSADDKNRVYETAIRDEEIQLLRKDLRDFANALASGEWVDRTCYFKPFGTQKTECEYCALAKEIYKNS